MKNSKRPPLSIIVAVAANNAIGKDNQLLWHIPEDLKRFKVLTMGHKMIMGKKTWESLPVRPLPGRTSIVLSDLPGEALEGAIVAYSIEEALMQCDMDAENFIIGGGSVYRQFLPLASKLYITRVHSEFEADTYFPEPDSDEWELIERLHHPANEPGSLSHSYEVYLRSDIPDHEPLKIKD